MLMHLTPTIDSSDCFDCGDSTSFVSKERERVPQDFCHRASLSGVLDTMPMASRFLLSQMHHGFLLVEIQAQNSGVPTLSPRDFAYGGDPDASLSPSSSGMVLGSLFGGNADTWHQCPSAPATAGPGILSNSLVFTGALTSRHGE